MQCAESRRARFSIPSTGPYDSLTTIHAKVGRQSPSPFRHSAISPIWSCATTLNPHSATRRPTSEKPGDLAVHVEWQPGWRISPGAWAWRYERETKRFLIDLVFEGNMRQLRAQKETNIAANLLSDSTWNPGDFRLDISAPMPCSRPVQSRCESTPASTRTGSMIGRGFCMQMPRGMVRQSLSPNKLIPGAESTVSVPKSKA